MFRKLDCRTPAVIFLLAAMVGCTKHHFNSHPRNVAEAAERVSRNLNLEYEVAGASDSFDLSLADAEGHPLGRLRLKTSPRDSNSTWVQADFRRNRIMPENMLRGYFLESLEQQIQIDSGTRKPHINPGKSFYKYQFGNLLSPSASTYYGLDGNPFYYPNAKYPAIAAQGVMEFGAIMTAIGYFDSDTEGQKERYLSAFLFYYGVSRGIGMILGWNLRYYEKVQALPYDLSAMRFYF